MQVTEDSYKSLVDQKKTLQIELEEADNQLNEMQAQLDAMKSPESIREVISEASAFWENAEYPQALTVLKNSRNMSDEINSVYKDYSQKYCVQMQMQAETLIASQKYDEAKKLLSDAANLVADNTPLQNKINEINSRVSKKLSELKISSSRHFVKIEDESAEDTVGNKYTPGNLFRLTDSRDEYGYATFYLGKAYTKFSCKIAVSDQTVDLTGLTGQVDIYVKTGEEYTGVHSSPELSRITNPYTPQPIDVTGADWLEIRYHDEAYWDGLQILLADAVVYND